MPTVLKALALLGALAVAQAASAIPFRIEITTDDAIGAGVWSLNGSGTTTTRVWAVGLGHNYADSTDVGDGDYSWSILGAGGGVGSISWVLSVGDWSYRGSDTGGLVFRVADSTRVSVVGSGPVSVPEPGTLLLLGTGLLGTALSIRRKRKAS